MGIVLGQATEYVDQYCPSLLEPIARQLGRDIVGIPSVLPFGGVDIWHGYELSWLDERGKPQVACAVFIVPCQSPYLIESKSFKLYLNSYNQTTFANTEEVEQTLVRDISAICRASVEVSLQRLGQLEGEKLQCLVGQCLDDLVVDIDQYQVDPSYLRAQGEVVEETWFSHLLKSNCPVTNQPDWGSVQIAYTGSKIDPEGLLRYIISYRSHQGFHEQCVEQIFCDIWRRCRPERLSVYACYTRRGG